jgi:DNA helicase-2/ATP-dependent DNA helicase PcrA
MDSFYKKRYKILGGPGCGKTTRIIEILDNYFKAGLQPSQVLMIGFAKATVNRLQEKVVKDLKFTEKQAESIKTIHKYCFDKIPGHEVFNHKAKREFTKKIKTDPDNWVMLDTDKDKEDDTFAIWTEEEDKKLYLIFQLIGYARHSRKKNIEEILEFHGKHKDYKFARIQQHEIKYCYKSYISFKKNNNMVDFEDMLEKALVDSINFPEYKVVMVDEVQDLTPLEWKVISKIGRRTEELFLVGDDDQAIYGWKGSNVKIFQKWPCKKENIQILPKTHRLPVNVYNLAQEIISDVTNRIGNEYEPMKEKLGVVSSIYNTSEMDDILNINSNAILCARGWLQCKPYVIYLKDRGLLWKEKSKSQEHMGSFISSFPEKYQKILKSWDMLKNGYGIKAKYLIEIIKYFKRGLVKHGKKEALTDLNTCPEEFKDPKNLFTYKDMSEKYFILADINKSWFDVFNFTTSRKKDKTQPNAIFDDDEDFNNYLRTCYENDSTLSKTDIIVSTIHGVKGMEKDKIILNSDWGFSYKNFHSGISEKEDEELRTCYVGVTRAKEELYIMTLGHKNNFDYLR